MKNHWYRKMRNLSQEGQAIAEMLFQALDGEQHTVRGRVGRFFRASLQIFGQHATPKASLRLVRCDEETGRTFGCARTIVVPIQDLRDPMTVAVLLEQRAFMGGRARANTRVTVEAREKFHRVYSARRVH
jgi:hypothetical protein